MKRYQLWVTRDGRRIKLRDMAAEHLENLLVHLTRSESSRQLLGKWARQVNRELARRAG